MLNAGRRSKKVRRAEAYVLLLVCLTLVCLIEPFLFFCAQCVSNVCPALPPAASALSDLFFFLVFVWTRVLLLDHCTTFAFFSFAVGGWC